MFSKRGGRRRRAATLLLLGLLFSVQAEADRSRPFVPKRELKGISAVHLDVDGLPNPIGEPRISEASIQARVESQLRESGLRVLSPGDDADAPTLRLTVLAPRRADDYAYMISLYLEESCTLNREPTVHLASCRTWSIFPRIGFLEAGRESALEAVASLAVQQFTDAWRNDNE